MEAWSESGSLEGSPRNWEEVVTSAECNQRGFPTTIIIRLPCRRQMLHVLRPGISREAFAASSRRKTMYNDLSDYDLFDMKSCVFRKVLLDKWTHGNTWKDDLDPLI